MRTHYIHQLNDLENMIGKMGGLLLGGLIDAKNAIKTGSRDSIRNAANMEKRTDVKTDEIERLCSLLLLTQQPVASDMRFIVAVMNIVVDMERIGDQLRDISETAGKCGEGCAIPLIEGMIDDCGRMIRDALDAFVGRDAELAEKTVALDDRVDESFEKLKTELSSRAQSGTSTDDLLNLLMIGKYLERIGDHATNIAEWTSYVATGHRR